MNLAISGSSKKLVENRLSIPSAGRTILSSAKPWLEPTATVFGMMTRSALSNERQTALWERYRKTFFPVMPSFEKTVLSEETKLRLCISAVLCEWMLCRIANKVNRNCSFEQAERWFLGEDASKIPGLVLGWDWLDDECLESLYDLNFDATFVDLMPYILEWFGNFTTYGNIPSREYLRAMKRKLGVAFTPSDLADFIVGQTMMLHQGTLTSIDEKDFKFGVLDIACGTGVFLRSALSILRTTSSQSRSIWDLVASLYGMDVSPQCVQSCAFVITAECLMDLKKESISPWRLWQAVRGNLVVVDSTLVYRDCISTNPHGGISKVRNSVRRELLGLQRPSLHLASRLEESQEADTNENYKWKTTDHIIEPSSLTEVFPEWSAGFPVVVGNPPYSRLPWDSHVGKRAAHFKSAPNSTKDKATSYYPLFVEMMSGLTSSESASAGIVTPLSIAYSSSSVIKRLREAIEATPGIWRFGFFDRTPDSLFGDDVKTRNAVVIWNRDFGTKSSSILTGPLLRWNSRNRKSLFQQVHYVPVPGLSVREFIPKLGSSLEVAMYSNTREVSNKASLLFVNSGAKWNDYETNDTRLLFYSSVAYNWLPVFRFRPRSDGEKEERSSLRFIECKDERDAWFFFACLVSRLTYWLWRVEGDGFHVTKDFIGRLPYHPSILTKENLSKLILSARAMWRRMQQHPVISVNKGKRTVSYYPYSCRAELDEIDRILLSNLGLDENGGFLTKFIWDNIVAGRDAELRGNLALTRLSDEES